MELARLSAKEQAGGSSPLVPINFLRLCSSTELERGSSKPDVVSSNLTKALFDFGFENSDCGFSNLFRVRLTAGRIALNDETEVRILYPKPIFSLRAA